MLRHYRRPCEETLKRLLPLTFLACTTSAQQTPAPTPPPTATPTATATPPAAPTATATPTPTPTAAAPIDPTRDQLTQRFASDPAAQTIALSLFTTDGDVVGVEKEHMMDGGYRGVLHLVPALPVDAERVHLERVARAFADYDRFFAALGGTPSYRWQRLSVLFFRSVRARTPSAYAHDWVVAYNVDGSLNKGDDEVRETMFHEIFHLNDAAHHDWSERVLAADYDRIVKKCGTDATCLAPYAPNKTMVRGGTFYAFQPGNDVREYAAELAIRYYREERGALGQGPKVERRFSCDTKHPENARAWSAIVTEFFGGVDRATSCP